MQRMCSDTKLRIHFSLVLVLIIALAALSTRTSISQVGTEPFLPFCERLFCFLPVSSSSASSEVQIGFCP